MAAKGLQLPWRRNGGAIPTKSDVIREMSANGDGGIVYAVELT
jgi:hypothetical protein